MLIHPGSRRSTRLIATGNDFPISLSKTNCASYRCRPWWFTGNLANQKDLERKAKRDSMCFSWMTLGLVLKRIWIKSSWWDIEIESYSLGMSELKPRALSSFLLFQPHRLYGPIAFSTEHYVRPPIFPYQSQNSHRALPLKKRARGVVWAQISRCYWGRVKIGGVRTHRLPCDSPGVEKDQKLTSTMYERRERQTLTHFGVWQMSWSFGFGWQPRWGVHPEHRLFLSATQ